MGVIKQKSNHFFTREVLSHLKSFLTFKPFIGCKPTAESNNFL